MRGPNELYNWYCVLHSVSNIARHAINIRIHQAASCPPSFIANKRRRLDPEAIVNRTPGDNTNASKTKGINDNAIELKLNDLDRQCRCALQPVTPIVKPSTGLPAGGNAPLPTDERADVISNEYSEVTAPFERNSLRAHAPPPPVTLESTATPEETSSQRASPPPEDYIIEELDGNAISNLHENIPTEPPLRSSKVPSSRIGRLFHYGSLAASLSYGAASEILRRSSNNDRPSTNSLLMTEANLNRLVSKLSRMRGAALKMGQFMSIQDTHVLPEELERVFRRVQDAAHYMPNWQMERVMEASLGPTWHSHFTSFSPIPTHAASIGQVHIGVLAAHSSPTGREEGVAIKIQFPDIARSISSDLGYLKLLLGASALLPKGLYLDSTIKVFKEELADECNYKREADYIQKYRDIDFLKSDPRYKVPWVWVKSTEQVLVMEHMKGVSVGGDVVKTLSQNDRNQIAEGIIELCLRELFEFRMMQTDPNWTNFLWNADTRQIELIDFGATREYSIQFIDKWLGLLSAAIAEDRDACIDWSLKLKYLIGGENEAMINAHLNSMFLLGTPFRASTHQPFSFAKNSEWTQITEQIRTQIPIMLNNRLTPPPRETYSLNRKLSGAFLLAGRLGACVDCRSLWTKVVGGD